MLQRANDGLRRIPFVKRSRRAWAIAGALMVALVVASVFSNRGFLGWGVIVIAVIMVLPFSQSRALLGAWVPYASMWFIFTFFRSFADETVLAKTLNTKVPHFERWIFGGELPSVRLQDALFNPNHLHWWDYYFTFTHWSYFLIPHVVAVYLWWKHPNIFRQYTYALMLMLTVGLLIYFLIPSNPPWMAPEAINTPGAPTVTRIMNSVGNELGGAIYKAGYDAIGESNPIAAMPSIHFAVTFMLFWVARTRGRIWTLLALFYAASMGVGLVYLGEHYAIDVTVGGIITTYSWFAVGAWFRRVAPVIGHPLQHDHGSATTGGEGSTSPVAHVAGAK